MHRCGDGLVASKNRSARSERPSDESSEGDKASGLNHLKSPAGKRVAATTAGEFVQVPDDPTILPGAPPRLGYSIPEFCAAVGISVSYFYELRQAGLAPRTMQGLGVRQIISVEEGQRWCRERTEACRLTGTSDGRPQHQ